MGEAIAYFHSKGYEDKVKELRKIVKSGEVDIFLVSAGALGKGYSYHIMECGGISLDIGQAVKYWIDGSIAERFRGILTNSDRPKESSSTRIGNLP